MSKYDEFPFILLSVCNTARRKPWLGGGLAALLLVESRRETHNSSRVQFSVSRVSKQKIAIVGEFDVGLATASADFIRAGPGRFDRLFVLGSGVAHSCSNTLDDLLCDRDLRRLWYGLAGRRRRRS